MRDILKILVLKGKVLGANTRQLRKTGFTVKDVSRGLDRSKS